MGSGNLTRAGFSSKVSRKGGNLEAGVIFAPDGLRWKYEKGMNLDTLVTNLLPMQWDSECSSGQKLEAGSSMQEREAQYIAAPVAWLDWREDLADRYLKIPNGATDVFVVLDDSGAAHAADENGRVLWSGERPREVTLTWTNEDGDHKVLVPVLDEFGRIAGTTLPKLALDQAWWQLSNFPLPPDEDDLLDDMGETEAGVQLMKTHHVNRATAASNYPIRQMMELVENIADKQVQVDESDWIAWCTRLEQCLFQAAESPALEEFVKLKINPLSPLWDTPFRPKFAEDGSMTKGQYYEEVLRKVECAWAVTSLEKLGASHAQII